MLKVGENFNVDIRTEGKKQIRTKERTNECNKVRQTTDKPDNRRAISID